jgi:hypothetical protein
MSFKGSLRFWAFGPVAWHVFMHALDPKSRRFYELSVGRRTWQVWPPPHILDHRTEWTVPTKADALATAEHCLRLVKDGTCG